MTKREELFQETEEKIDDTTRRLRTHFFNLGIMLFRNPDILPSEMGVSLVKASSDAEKAYLEAEEKKKEDEEFIRTYDSRKERKIEVDDTIETLRLQEREDRLMLGALIYEQCSLDLLPREKFSAVYDDADSEKALNEKTRSKSFWSRLRSSSALNRLKRSDRMRYLDYSCFADSDENALSISGEKAQNLISALREIREKRGKLQKEEEELEEFLSSSLQRRKNLGKGGMEEDESSCGERKNAFDECIINYGNYLYDRGGSWIDENTPAEVLDLLQLILECQGEYSRLKRRLEQLNKEAKADDYKAMIDEEREKIRILEMEKGRIDTQIEEIRREIERLEGLVERLVRTQEEK